MEPKTMASALVNAATAILALYAWLSLMFSWGKSSGLLADRGLRSLRYFTVQSNLFSGGVSLACVIAYLALGPVLPTWLVALKLVATTAVMLTFTVVILVLVPAYDLKSMYMGSNFLMHLILLLLADLVLDCKDLEYISSAGLREFLGACKYVSENGSHVIKNCNDNVLGVFKITKLGALLNTE